MVMLSRVRKRAALLPPYTSRYIPLLTCAIIVALALALLVAAVLISRWTTAASLVPVTFNKPLLHHTQPGPLLHAAAHQRTYTRPFLRSKAPCPAVGV